jgi:hypothetical protein
LARRWIRRIDKSLINVFFTEGSWSYGAPDAASLRQALDTENDAASDAEANCEAVLSIMGTQKRF